jgi:DNA-binding transcriptional regulator YiaG
MRYYESVFDRFLSKLPSDGVSTDPKKLTRNDTRKLNNIYNWKPEELVAMREMRLQGVSFQVIATRFNASKTAVQRVARENNMVSPNSNKYNKPTASE